MNQRSIRVALLGLALCAGLSATAYADTPAPSDHPRVDEVNQRLDNQQKRIDQGVANGTIAPKQQARDEKHLANIAKRESVDEAKHNGHLTKGEQRRLNHAENRNSRHIHRQKQG